MANTLLTTTIVGAAVPTTLAIKEDKGIKKERFGPWVGASITSTATSAIGVSINNNGIDHIHNKYANAYVESMSDEELADALMQMNLLEEIQDEIPYDKTI